MQRLREEAEKAKKELSSAMNANINLPFIAMTKDRVRIIWILILQDSLFESMTADLIDRDGYTC